MLTTFLPDGMVLTAAKVTYRFTVTDGSSDTCITLSNAYTAGGVVTNGDISIQ